jgi:hypothetical protein
MIWAQQVGPVVDASVYRVIHQVLALALALARELVSKQDEVE